jgi:hypothetical protein
LRERSEALSDREIDEMPVTDEELDLASLVESLFAYEGSEVD